jgi:hypothetical protein
MVITINIITANRKKNKVEMITFDGISHSLPAK